MWPDLPSLPMPVSLVSGALDTKFVNINSHMYRVMQQRPHKSRSAREVTLHVIKNAGHAVHIEQPLQFQRILVQLCKSSSLKHD